MFVPWIPLKTEENICENLNVLIAPATGAQIQQNLAPTSALLLVLLAGKFQGYRLENKFTYCLSKYL